MWMGVWRVRAVVLLHAPVPTLALVPVLAPVFVGCACVCACVVLVHAPVVVLVAVCS